ncbi:MAG: hypothetical protein ACLFNS_12285 [Desulfobacterales bacterium]
MIKQQTKEKLIQELTEILSGGICLPDAVVHYIDSTLSPASGEELTKVLMDADNCEAETAVELIFFPDAATQERLEPILSEAILTEAEISEVVHTLSQKNLQARLCFPDERGQAILPVPETAIRQMMNRLRPTVTISRQIAEAIDHCLPEAEDACRMRVKLRNARIGQTNSQINFLCTLIKAIAPPSAQQPSRQPDDFWNLLDLAIFLLEQTEPGADIYEALMTHKQHLIKAVRAGEKNQQALASNTVEALIMKGMNVSAIDLAAAREKIDQIDRISIAVYGRTEFLSALAPAGGPMDLSVQDKEDMAAVLRLLS